MMRERGKFKAFFQTTTLGLEITPSRIRLVEADTARWPIKILNFVFLDPLSPHEDNIIQQLRGVLDRGWFKTNKVNLAVSHPYAIHRLLTLPHMPAEETRAIAERELEEIKQYPGGFVFDWRITGTVEEEGTRKNEVLVVAAPLPEVDRQRSLAKRSGLKCGVLTTTPIALLSSLRFVEAGERDAIALLYLETEQGCLVFVRKGKWCFSRQFPVEGNESILSEVKRAFHYFRRGFRGEDIDRIVISGDGGKVLDPVMKDLEETFGIEVVLFNPAYGLELNLPGGRHQEWDQASPGLAVVLGLAAESFTEPFINLVPARFKERRRRLREAFLALAVIFLLGAGYAGLSRHTESLKVALHQKEAILKKFQPSLEKARKEKEKKERYNKYVSFLQKAEHRSPWVKVFQVLSLIVPDEMVFHSLKAERMEGGVHISINGEIRAGDAFTAQEIFNRFYSRFKSCPLFSRIELMPIDITRTEKKRSKVDFEIRFQLKEES